MRGFPACQLLFGHRKLEGTVRYLRIEIDDALEISEQIDLEGVSHWVSAARELDAPPASVCCWMRVNGSSWRSPVAAKFVPGAGSAVCQPNPLQLR